MTNLSDAVSVTQNIHLYMVPLLGTIFTFLLLAGWLLLAFKPSFARVLRWINLVFCILQAFISIFFWFNPIWIIGLQLLLVAAFGLFAFITNRSDHIKVFGYLALFNTLVCFGKLQFMGYATNLLDAPLAFDGPCDTYYGTSDSDAICYGYVNYLRFLAFILIVLQPLETFFAYLSYKHFSEEETHLTAGYGNIADKVYDGQRKQEEPSHAIE